MDGPSAPRIDPRLARSGVDGSAIVALPSTQVSKPTRTDDPGLLADLFRALDSAAWVV